jgi:hypothetical protein
MVGLHPGAIHSNLDTIQSLLNGRRYVLQVFLDDATSDELDVVTTYEHIRITRKVIVLGSIDYTQGVCRDRTSP